MAKDSEKHNLVLVSIVGIVAIVAMTVLFNPRVGTSIPTTSNQIDNLPSTGFAADRGNLRSGATNDLLVFVIETPDDTGNFGPDAGSALNNADRLCNEAAIEAEYPGKYRALLSNSDIDARDRIVDGVYKNLYGKTLASGIDELFSGNLRPQSYGIEPLHKIQSVPYVIYTGTKADGTANILDGDGTCNDWTDDTNDYNGAVGLADETNSDWIISSPDGRCDPQFGNTYRGIYCIQISPGNPLCGNNYKEIDEVCDDGNIKNGDGCSSTCQLENECGDGLCGIAFGENSETCAADCDQEGEYLIFVTETIEDGEFPWGVDHIDHADEVCQTNAESLGYEGKFVAWLRDATDFNPRDRLANGIYYNIYGAKIANSKREFFDLPLLNPIDNFLAGEIDVDRSLVWTGAYADGDLASDCENWNGGDQGFGEGGSVGSTYETDSDWSLHIWAENCPNVNHPFYCFEVEPDPATT